MPPRDRYTHGHHESVLQSHGRRTAENSAAYLLPLLRPGMSVLDVGCGPGTITRDLAARVAPGLVTGLDADQGVVERARAEFGGGTLEFRTGDVYALDAADATFDVVHAHQVLQHLSDPVAALAEMHRVLRPGGTLAVRDGDYAAFAWAPRLPGLDAWMDLYHGVTAANGGEADAGRFLPGWVRAAGFQDLRVSSSTWTYATPPDRAWWAGTWADRARYSAFADQAVAYGLAERADLEEIAEAWREWAASPDGTFVIVHVEVLATR
ncbi:MAG: methyltransferase domain-containing protein [Thermoleophilia bacterium]